MRGRLGQTLIKRVLGALVVAIFMLGAYTAIAWVFRDRVPTNIKDWAQVPSFKLKTVRGRTVSNEDFKTGLTMVWFIDPRDDESYVVGPGGPVNAEFDQVRTIQYLRWFRPDVHHLVISRTKKTNLKMLNAFLKGAGVSPMDVAITVPELHWKFSGNPTFVIGGGMASLGTLTHGEFTHQVDLMREAAAKYGN